MIKNILITGCAGFIGSHATDYFLAKGHNIVGVDSLTYAGSLDNISEPMKNDRFYWYKNDICNTEDIVEYCVRHNIEWIINFAAESHVDNSIKNIDPFLKSNIMGVVSLLNVCRRLGIKIFHISTDEVYGSIEEKSFNEDDRLNPKNPYSSSKASAEHFVTSYHNTYNIDYKMVRMSNNFGPRQNGEKLIPTVIRSLMEGNKIPVYGEGKNIRDWFYVKDCVNMIYDVFQCGSDNETYNLTHGFEMENLCVIEKICEIMGKNFLESILFVPDRPGHDFRYSICNKKLGRIVSSEPTIFDSALRDTVEYFKNRDKK